MHCLPQVTSETADVVTQSVLNLLPVANLASDSWVSVNPILSSPANPTQWPLVLVTYFYVRQNSTSLGDAGGLLLQFLQFMLSNETSLLMGQYYFYPLPAQASACSQLGV